MKRLLLILVLLPAIGISQVSSFMGRYDVSRVDSVNDSIFLLTGKFIDVTGSWTAMDADTGDKIIQRGYNSTGKIVFDRYVITGIDYATPVDLEVFVKSDFSAGIQNMTGIPFTGSFPIASPTSDTSMLTYRASFYQNGIDPDYDAALDNMNLNETWKKTESGVNSYSITVQADGSNNWSVPLQLKPSSVIIYNTTPLKHSTQWNIVSPGILTVNLDVKKYDHIVLIN
jgi:hypothetical protein